MAYLVMDCVEGQTLAEYVRRAPHLGKVPPGAEILRLVTSISLAIDYAHLSNVIHGNLKPTNIFLPGYITSSNQIGEPLIADFGIFGLRDDSANKLALRSLETALYISPGQAKGLAGTECSDIYSLGLILFEMCTGVLPFQGNRPFALTMQHLSATPTSPSFINPCISPALSTVILRCLAKDPEMRYPRASTMCAALAKALNMPVPERLHLLADQTGRYDRSSSADTPNTPTILTPASSSPLPPTSRPPISTDPAQANYHASFTAGAGQGSESPPALSYPAPYKRQRSRYLPFALLLPNIGANETGTTLVRFSAHGGPGFLFNTVANPGTKGPNAEAFNTLTGNVWVANVSGNDVQVFTPTGHVLATITNPLFHKPWGLVSNQGTPNPHGGSIGAFFIANVADATIDRIDILPGQHAPIFRVSQIGQLTRSGPETKIALTWVHSLRLHGMLYSDVLLAIDGAANRIAAYANSSTRGTMTRLSTDKGMTAFQGLPLKAPIGFTLNPLNGDLLVVNQNDNNLVELNLSSSRAVGTRQLDNVPVDQQTGNGSALIGVAAGIDAKGNLEVFFTDDNTNTLDVLSM